VTGNERPEPAGSSGDFRDGREPDAEPKPEREPEPEPESSTISTVAGHGPLELRSYILATLMGLAAVASVLTLFVSTAVANAAGFVVAGGFAIAAVAAWWGLNSTMVSIRAAESDVSQVPAGAEGGSPALDLLVMVSALMLTVGLGLMFTQRWGSEDLPGAAKPAPEFKPPSALPADGEYVQSRVLASGDLEVDHWIRSTRAIFDLTLSLPTTIRNGQSRAMARGVRVESDSGKQRGADAVGTTPESYSMAGASMVHVSYVLNGAVVRSSSASDRVLAQVTSLDLTFTHDRVPKTVMLIGGRPLAAACAAQGPNAEPRPCGNADGKGWRVMLDAAARHDRVMLQLDLP
jgi:hypothetical protein